jgi:hypothetical protein
VFQSVFRRVILPAISFLFLATFFPACFANAQTTLATSSSALAALPDAPSFFALNLAPPAPEVAGARTLPSSEAPHTDRYPLPGQAAPVLSAGDKFRMGVRGAVSFYSIAGWLAAAGYSQITNGPPNWGTDRGAFGIRLADEAISSSTEDFLSDSVMSPLMHQDPRYFRLGHGHPFLRRLVYAATRPLITRTDGGRTVPNFALMSGNLAGAALTNLYYPDSNRSVSQTFISFGGAIGGSALGDGIAEFFGGLLFDHGDDHTSR